MVKQNVNSSAKIINEETNVQPFMMGTFVGNTQQKANESQENDSSNNPQKMQYIEPKVKNDDVLIAEIKQLGSLISNVDKRISTLESEGVKAKDLDKQVVNALKDLKNYASFYEKSALSFESKVLKTSIAIAQKIIGLEVAERSAKIATQTIENILNKISTASKISIHLNPKDYLIIKNEITFDTHVSLFEDPNVMPGGVVIASDLGNFDGNIDAKVATMLESLDTIS